MSIDLSWIKQQDLAIIILYKKLQALSRVFFFPQFREVILSAA